MAAIDNHDKCVYSRKKCSGNDPCVIQAEICDNITEVQRETLTTNSYKISKESQLVGIAQFYVVNVLGNVDQQVS